MIRYFVKHPNAANLVMIALLLLGLTTLPQMKRETFPELKSDQVQVKVPYPGATATEVEDAICRRVEDALDGVVDLRELRCEAQEGAGVAVARMYEHGNMTRFLDDVKTEVEAINDFPAEVDDAVVSELGRTDDVISIAVTGIRDVVALKAYAQDLKARMLRVPQIEQIGISGFSDHQIRIEVPAWQLERYGLSITALADTLNRQSLGMPVGRLEGADEDVLIRFDDQRKGAEAFRNIVILSQADGAEVRLGEIAHIEDRFDRPEEAVHFNGQRAALLTVRKNRSQDTLLVLDAVKSFVEQERQRLPTGIALALTRDMSSVVRDRLQLLLTNGAQGLVLVFLVLWLFFSLRYSFWVTMGLPVAFLGGLFVIGNMGVTINMISMVGLLIAIGLLMDDAIVIAENIAARLARGEDYWSAAVNGVRQVLPGVFSSYLTTVLIFGSVAFITGNLGQILRVLPVVLLVVMSVSLIEAFLILPNHLAHTLRHVDKPKGQGIRAAFEAGFERFRDGWFTRVLDAAIRQRYLTIGVIVMLLLVSLSLAASGVLGFRGFPDIEGDTIEAWVLLPQGTPLHRTQAIVDRLQHQLEQLNAELSAEQPDGQTLVQSVTVLYGQNPDAYESGPHVVRVSVDLLSTEVRTVGAEEVLERWRHAVGAIPDVINLKFTEATIGPAGRAIDIRLHGNDLQRLREASRQLQHWLNQYDGVLDLGDDLRPGKREYQLRLKAGAEALGLDGRQISDQIRVAFQGQKIDEFPIGPESYEVDLRLAAADRLSRQQLAGFRVIVPDGSQIPLEAVAEVEEARGWARILRVDGERTISVQGDVNGQVINARALVQAAEKSFFPQLSEAFPDIGVSIEGETKESGETSGSMVSNFLLGLVGVYLVLAFQFRGYLMPLAVMTVIPTALIGVFWGHLVMGRDLSMPSMMGAASLAGIVVNNSILLVQFIKSACSEGVAVEVVALQAGVQRFRPIMLTSFTTLAGLLPLLSETSVQAQVLIPLATSLAFGLAAATVIAMFLVPALYCVMDDLNLVEELE